MAQLRPWVGLVPTAWRPVVAEILRDAVGGGQTAAARRLITQSPAVLLCRDDQPLAAAVGHESGRGFTVEAIAVARTARGSGHGRQLLDEVARLGGHQWIEAETDATSVGFYRACGFSITSLGEVYPGVERFACRRVT